MSFASLVEPVPHESRSEEESSEERSDRSRLSRLMRSAPKMENSRLSRLMRSARGPGSWSSSLERRVGSAPCDLVGRAAIPVQGVPVAARIEPRTILLLDVVLVLLLEVELFGKLEVLLDLSVDVFDFCFK